MASHERPSVEDIATCYSTPGHMEFERRLQEARGLLDAGMTEPDVAEAVLWSVQELRHAIRAGERIREVA